MPPVWLDTGDKIASLVGAVAGVTSLLVQVMATVLRKPAATEGTGGRRPRRWTSRISLTAFVTAGVAGLVLAAPSTARGEPDWRLGAAVVLVAATAAVHGAVGRREPVTLNPAVRHLLAEQRREAERHRYHLTGSHLPRVTTLYVQQRADAGVGHAGRAVPGDRGPMTPLEILTRFRHAVIVAEPGAGKSTLTAHLAAASSDWWQAARRGSRKKSPFGETVALRLPAPRLVGRDLAAALADHFSRHGDEVARDMFTRPPLEGARWLVLVDGLDEIADPDERSRVLTTLSTSAEQRSDVFRFLITTRPLPPGELAELVRAGAADLRLRLFDASDLRRFAQRWFEARPVAGAGAEPLESARTFVAGIRRSGMSALPRVPLLVTMAALLYERDPSAGLPADRTRLYEEFVTLLRAARRRPTETAALAWTEHEDRLLAHLAAIRVHTPERHLLEAAVEWTSEWIPSESIAGMTRSVLTSTVLNRLLATSLLVADGTDVVFPHQSLAEYLAAGSEPFDEVVWRRAIGDPASREFALFVLGRAGPPVDGFVPCLLDGTDADLVAAGRVIADGYRVKPEVAEAVVTSLLSRVRAGERGEECLDVLTDLAVTRPELVARLAEVSRDRDVPDWTRAIVADALVDVDRKTACALLAEIGLADELGTHPVRRWCADRLLAHADDRAAHRIQKILQVDGDWEIRSWALDLDDLLPPLPDVPERALAALADDPRQQIFLRVQAATALLEHAAPVAARILTDIATDHGEDQRARFEAARVLAQRARPPVLTGLEVLAESPSTRSTLRCETAILLTGHEDARGRLVLRDLAGTAEESWVRFRAARKLWEDGIDEGRDVLRRLAIDERTGLRTRVAAGRLLIERDDAHTRAELRQVVTQADGLSARYCAARALHEAGDATGTAALRELAASPAAGPHIRHATGLALLRAGDPTGVAVLEAVATQSADSQARITAARSLMPYDAAAAVAALRSIFDEPRVGGHIRYQAASSLLEHGDEVPLARLAAQVSDRLLRVAIAQTLHERGDSAGLVLLRDVLCARRSGGAERRARRTPRGSWSCSSGASRASTTDSRWWSHLPRSAVSRSGSCWSAWLATGRRPARWSGRPAWRPSRRMRSRPHSTR